MEAILETKYALDTFYFLVSGALVMWMAAGFAMLEAGLVRAKNTAEILTKNISLFAVACIMYMLIGYGIMYPGDAAVNSWWPGLHGILGNADNEAAAVVAGGGPGLGLELLDRVARPSFVSRCSSTEPRISALKTFVKGSRVHFASLRCSPKVVQVKFLSQFRGDNRGSRCFRSASISARGPQTGR